MLINVFLPLQSLNHFFTYFPRQLPIVLTSEPSCQLWQLFQMYFLLIILYINSDVVISSAEMFLIGFEVTQILLFFLVKTWSNQMPPN